MDKKRSYTLVVRGIHKDGETYDFCCKFSGRNILEVGETMATRIREHHPEFVNFKLLKAISFPEKE